MKKIWEGRIKKKLDELAEKFNRSVDFDKKFFKYDVQAGIAHSKALYKAGVITKNELNKLAGGLKKLLKMENKIKWENYEDVHSAVEIELTKLIGNIGKKLHTGRSRNDLVATDERLFLKDKIKEIKKLILNLLKTFIIIAEKNKNVFISGFTHLQQAQIVSVAQFLLSYYNKIKRDYELLKFVEKRVDCLPLASGALAGSNYPLDRNFLAKELGFSSIMENSMDAVSDRDFIIDFVYFTVLTSLHLSRLAEDLIIYNSNEFAYIEIDDSFATGSSIMPNKKNPDILELMRGKTGAFTGNLISLVVMLKGLPLTYNKDMQEDKLPLFNSVENIIDILKIADRILYKIEFNKEKIKESIDKSFMYAVDIADFLVGKGIPFRDAHKITGNLISYCIEKNKKLNEVTEEDLKNILPDGVNMKEINSLLNPEKSVNLKKTMGSTNLNQINLQIKNAKKYLANEA